MQVAWDVFERHMRGGELVTGSETYDSVCVRTRFTHTEHFCRLTGPATTSNFEEHDPSVAIHLTFGMPAMDARYLDGDAKSIAFSIACIFRALLSETDIVRKTTRLPPDFVRSVEALCGCNLQEVFCDCKPCSKTFFALLDQYEANFVASVMRCKVVKVWLS